jgi:hypothetical protein
MRRTMFIPFTLALIAGVADAQPVEIMLRDATGYPDSSHTDGGLSLFGMPGNSSNSGETSYHITALYLDLVHRTSITALAGVGFDMYSQDFNWDATIWRLNVWHAADDHSARELFELSPKQGNVISNQILSETHEDYGDGDYYLTWLPPDDLMLPPGSYLLSVRGYLTPGGGGATGLWSFRESSVDLGSDVYAESGLPGQSFEFTTDMSHLGYVTGTSALDIWGYEITCIGDFNFDGVIDLSDLGTLLANFEVGDGMMYEQGDIDFDGDVDLSDLGALLAVYEVPCE